MTVYRWMCGHENDSALVVQCTVCGSNDPSPYKEPEPIPESPTAAQESPTAAPESPSPERKPRLLLDIDGNRVRIDDGQQIGLGRDPMFGPIATLLAPHDNVSRVHGVLRFADGTVFVEDSDSSNGTFVDGVRIAANKEYELHPDQALRLASDVTIRFSVEAS